jgi:hypothetical protein
MSAMPRSDGIAIGSTMERNVWTLEPNEEARQRNVGTAIAVFAAMRPLDPKRPMTRAAAPAEAPSVQTFFDPELR